MSIQAQKSINNGTFQSVLWTVLDYFEDFEGSVGEFEGIVNIPAKIDAIGECLAEGLQGTSLVPDSRAVELYNNRNVKTIDISVLQWFQKSYPAVPVKIVAALEKQVGEGIKGLVIEYGQNSVAKFPKNVHKGNPAISTNLISTIRAADQLMKLPPHSSISPFLGVIHLGLKNTWGLLFGKVDGPVLSAWQYKAGLTLLEQAAVALDIGRGLAHMDVHGFAYMDLNDENVMVIAHSNKAVIIDIDQLPHPPRQIERLYTARNFFFMLATLGGEAQYGDLAANLAAFEAGGWPSVIAKLEQILATIH